MSLKDESNELQIEAELIEKLKALILKAESYTLESYTDYPEAAKENAKIALRYAEEN